MSDTVVRHRRGKQEARAVADTLQKHNPDKKFWIGEDLIHGEWLWCVHEVTEEASQNGQIG